MAPSDNDNASSPVLPEPGPGPSTLAMRRSSASATSSSSSSMSRAKTTTGSRIVNHVDDEDENRNYFDAVDDDDDFDDTAFRTMGSSTTTGTGASLIAPDSASISSVSGSGTGSSGLSHRGGQDREAGHPGGEMEEDVRAPGSTVVGQERVTPDRSIDGSYVGGGAGPPGSEPLSPRALQTARRRRPIGAPPLPVSTLTSSNLALLNGRIPIPQGKDEWYAFVKEYLASEIRHHSQLFNLDEGKSTMTGTSQAVSPTETGRRGLPDDTQQPSEQDEQGPEPSSNGLLAGATQAKDEHDERIKAAKEAGEQRAKSPEASPKDSSSPKEETEEQFHERLRHYHPALYEADDTEPYAQQTPSELGAELDEDAAREASATLDDEDAIEDTLHSGDMTSNQDPSVPNIPDATNQRSRREYAAHKRMRVEQERYRRESHSGRPVDEANRVANEVKAEQQGRQVLARGLGQMKSPTVRTSDFTEADRVQMAALEEQQHGDDATVAKLQDLKLQDLDSELTIGDIARPSSATPPLPTSRSSSVTPSTLLAQSEATPKINEPRTPDEMRLEVTSDESRDDKAPPITERDFAGNQLDRRGQTSIGTVTPLAAELGATSRHGLSSAGRSLLGTMDSRSWNVSTTGVGPTVEDEAERIRKFYERNGYMSAPMPSFESLRRRSRAVRRLGLDRSDQPIHRPTLDRFTRLACSIFRTKMSTITIIGQEKQLFPAEVGLGVDNMELDLGFCTHTALSAAPCMIVEDASKDWRFRNHPMVQQGKGPIRFYAGCPLIFGTGRRSATVGTLCVIDSEPRYDFNQHAQQVLSDLAGCVVNEMELLYQEMNQQAQRKMHQVTVNFLRRSLEVIVPRPVASKKPLGKGETIPPPPDPSFSLHDEACQVMRDTLEASAIAIVDLSQFHIFWPSHQPDTEGVQSSGDTSSRTGTSTTGGSAESGEGDDPVNPYRRTKDRKQARPLINTTSRQVPNVQFVPRRRRSDPTESPGSKADTAEIPILGLAVSSESARFNFESPEAKRIICEFIALNLGQRRVWYERDESQAIAASINVLMPQGTQVSLALPVFDFHGQASFCVTACWNDELFTYDNSVIAFVENICGTLQAGSLRNRLSALERSQRAFAALTNHEIRTPMHQILSTANLMRTALLETTPTDGAVPSTSAEKMFVSPDKRAEIDMLCKTLETSGHTLQGILNDVLDYLDVGGEHAGDSKTDVGDEGIDSGDANGLAMETLLSSALLEAYRDEARARSVTERDLSKVEIMLEIVPRSSGGWTLAKEANALKRAIYKLCLNALQATDTGFVKVICEDVSRHAQVPAGYKATMPSAIIAIRIYDTGKGMSKEFCDHEVFKPFTKEDPFSPGSGLGVTLAQRMVDLMGGRMTFTSEKGQGTLAVVEVPLVFQGNLSSEEDNEDEDDDDEAVSDTESEVTTRPICLLGFGGTEELYGQVELRKCLKRQLSRLKCKLTNNIAQAGLLIVESSYDLLKHHPEIRDRHHDDLHVIFLCPARIGPVSRRNRTSTLEDTDIPVEYFYRPLLPATVVQMVTDRDQDEILPSPQHSRQPSLSGSPEPTPELRLHLMTPKEPNSSATSPAVEHGDDFGRRSGSDVQLGPAPTGRSRHHHSAESDGESLGKESTGRDSIESTNPMYKVLVVEDNLVNRKLLAGTLRKMGIQCVEAVDGVEGVAEYRKFRPSLVLLDINMPRKDGFETAAEIRAYEAKRKLPRSRIVAVTALSGESNRRRGLIESDIDEWLTKPVTIRNLRQDIEKLRERASAPHEDDGGAGAPGKEE